MSVIKVVRAALDQFSAREVLFTLPNEVEGETDVEHTIPVKVAPTKSLWLLKQIDEFGEIHGSLVVLEEMLGKDSFAALLASEDVTAEQLNEIAKVCVERVVGAPQGN